MNVIDNNTDYEDALEIKKYFKLNGKYLNEYSPYETFTITKESELELDPQRFNDWLKTVREGHKYLNVPLLSSRSHKCILFQYTQVNGVYKPVLHLHTDSVYDSSLDNITSSNGISIESEFIGERNDYLILRLYNNSGQKLTRANIRVNLPIQYW